MHAWFVWFCFVKQWRMETLARRQVDGVDQWRALTVPEAAPARTSLIYNIDPVANLSAIRVGDWKLIVGAAQKPDVRQPTASYLPLCGKEHEPVVRQPPACLAQAQDVGPWLFNLKLDPLETANLYTAQPQRAAELRVALEKAAEDMLYRLRDRSVSVLIERLG
jgi:hypothetical protein|eukprot:COSAG01_NODE_3409_length_6127_cov_19.096384_8_plen_164_part_00